MNLGNLFFLLWGSIAVGVIGLAVLGSVVWVVRRRR